jgi:hypothetical protein
MRLQLADGAGRPYRRKGSLGDASAIIGQAIGAIKKAAQNPNVQKGAATAAAGIIGGLIKRKKPATSGGGGNVPMQMVMPQFDIAAFTNQLTGAQSKIEELQKANESLKTQRIYYGLGGLAVGSLAMFLVNRRRSI